MIDRDRRVLITIDRWYGELTGGARRLAGRWAEWLVEAGYTVDLVCGRDPAAPPPKAPHPRLAIHCYPNPQAPSPSLRNLRAHRAATREIVSRLRQGPPIAVHHGHIPLNFLGACDALDRRQTRQLYTVHSPYAHELRAQWQQNLTWKRRLALTLAKRLEGKVLERAERVHGLSRFTQSLLPPDLRRPDSKYHLVPGAISSEQAPPADAAYTGLAAWCRGRPTFFALRRLESRMGLESLLQACAQLRNEGRDFCLVVAGSGSRLADLKALRHQLSLGPQVKFLGYVPDAALEEVYGHAHCAILPSSGLECFGLTLLEAQLRGLPIIATPVGAIPETIGSNRQTWLTASPEAPDLADRMRDFLEGRLPFKPERLRAYAGEFVEAVMFPRWEAELILPLLQSSR